MNRISIIILFIIIALISHGQGIDKNLEQIKSVRSSKSESDFWHQYKSNSVAQSGIGKSLTSSGDYGEAPDFNWAAQFGGSSADKLYDVTSDENGFIYSVGYFTGEITVGTQTFVSVGISDGIVVKADNSGNIAWAKQLSPQRGEKLKIYGVTVDNAENVYVTGDYTGDITLGSTTLTSTAKHNLFYTKLNSTGEFVFAKSYDNNGDNLAGFKIKTDSIGDFYMIGIQTFDADYDDVNELIYAPDETFSRIIKIDNSGNILWDYYYEVCISDIEISLGHIYYVGTNSNNPGVLNNISLGLPQNGRDIFYAKSNLAGDYIWGFMPLHDNTSGYYGYSWFPTLSMDPGETLYLSGYFSYDMILGSDTLKDYTTYSRSFFVAESDSSGGIQWADNFQIPSFSKNNVSTHHSGWLYLVYGDECTIYNWQGDFIRTFDFIYSIYDIEITQSDYRVITCGESDEFGYISQSDTEFVEDWLITNEGNSGKGHVIGMVTDNNNHLYTYGYTSNTAEYFGYQINKGIFLVKQNSFGEILWLKQFPYDDFMDYKPIGYQLIIDTINSFLCFTGELESDLVIPGETTLSTDADGGLFYAKFDLEGNYISSVIENFNVINPSLSVDLSGEILLTGRFNDTVTVVGNTYVGFWDNLIIKYNINGDILWSKHIEGDDIEFDPLSVFDSLNNIFVATEAYSEKVYFSDDSISLEEGNGNIIYAKLSPNGETQWIKSFAGSPRGDYDRDCWPSGLKLVHDGVLMKGWHGDSVYFDDIMLRGEHGYNIGKFLTKIDYEGNAVWATTINEAGWGFDYCQFDTDQAGNIYLGLAASDTIYFNSQDYYVPYNHDLVVLKYDLNGNILWGKSIPTSNYPGLSSIMVNNTNNVFVGGRFSDTLSVDENLFMAPNRHGFVMMLGESVFPPTATVWSDARTVCENDSVMVSIGLTGSPPWEITYTNGTNDTSIITRISPYNFYTKEGGAFEVTALADTNYTGTYFGNSATVTYNPQPIADFTYEQENLTINFTNRSNNTVSYTWEFGDGLSTTAVNPVHTYLNFGTYDVKLTAISENCGSVSETITINLSTSEINDQILDNRFSIYPNPSNGEFVIEIIDLNTNDVQIGIISSNGQTIYTNKLNSTDGKIVEEIDISEYPSGLYLIQLHKNGVSIGSSKIIISNSINSY